MTHSDASTTPSDWTVYKFGGSSLADPACIRRVVNIISDQQSAETGPLAVVVSAMKGVTDKLLTLAERAPGADAMEEDLVGLRTDQREVVTELLPVDQAAPLLRTLDQDINDLTDVLRATHLMRTAPDTVQDLVAGYGEIWSARTLAQCLQAEGYNARFVDARDVVTVTHGQLGPVVDWERTRERLTALRESFDERDGGSPDVLVITGFIASTPDGVPTTLGRNGSDFSAAIFAALLEAMELHIWSDVNGVMSADPRYVPDAQQLDTLSYEEAMELAYFGARIIHPRTLQPVLEHEIPVTIRNTFASDHPGTRIHLDGEPTDGGLNDAVKGFSTIDNVALLNLEGTGMIGVPGIARRLFSALEDADISVIVISQGSSEHSICFAVPEDQADRARQATEEAFYSERHQGQVKDVDVTRNCSVLAVVGDGMSGTPGVASTFFGALGKAGVNVRAIAQGASERNISAVVDGADAQRALRAAHAGFYLSARTLSVGIIGVGNVGAALLDQLAAQVERLRTERRIDVRVRGIANTSGMLLDEHSIDLQNWREALTETQEVPDLDAFVDHVRTDYHPHTAIVDCTASGTVAGTYAEWLGRGIHVVTPNKRANTASWDQYRRLQQLTRGVTPSYLYETTVGAGLPILQTLHNLVQTGDRVHRVEGILSGTLSYLFNAFDETRTFSAILKQAKDAGFTEPDPRDDLSGMDVARKVVILAREMGLPLDLSDVAVDGLVPDELKDGDVDSFLDRLPEHDDRMTDILRTAQAQGEVLRFVGSVDRDGEALVQLQRYPKEHAFARISHTDNIVRFQTDRYQQNPLIVQGPGAGPEVTAAGVFADLLRLIA
ncbi:bifunctional aspartate kinase/homoserine dehydrogenase I [Longibacter salinarum]|uniref:Bifunctional aspartate kinase/homoserine dehydrogenase I n=1 Tax=Longibacter salinarum TaxID=1850348 RepID=A0A2A8CXN7_9BACT|nr:bifunctional aspartate kinase/homoserine dehydrogenase I [Longibacter salinarum]PEN13465.1 bifunctional aspartate kinase/homoserine dehydrogenase I [Longibacter salinarum]